ncbi:NAD(P)/FAD-dependent oxidoreductase [Leptospira noguchii]|uniref:NAD(P)-binding Rossmann-like domain protein n=1 Tax=Leptospira noguchii serovar Autumnalis str. ZUN142 TaxID=1085540 RepID=M6UNQ3_9LEPT|nr:FAD-dependent oxidoreductase [Leptospira noguchii]EMO42679.1 NAD(P)-binding Rossmann-like domain protein [Leptospira noguchii serovar Autumnalis str. ZUN142]UOG62361.1 FAD-dependent oxidoreductase [Leptospira noguchii]
MKNYLKKEPSHFVPKNKIRNQKTREPKKKESIAIIGTGISGMGCAHFLQKDFDLKIFEKESYIGGHTNTIDVIEEEKLIPIDTGFIVFNHVTYPNLKRLFEELDVPTKKTSMSFSVQHVSDGLEFCGSGIGGLFAQKKNLINPRFFRLLYNINRFNKKATDILEDPKYLNYTLEDFVIEQGYHRDLLEYYLVPMSSAVWSMVEDKMLKFPAFLLVKFFLNHGFLGLNAQHQWYTVQGGSKEYVKRLTAPILNKFQLNSEVKSVEPVGNKVGITLKKGKLELFDKVILATHADTSLKLLSKPSVLQRQLLKEFKYQKNVATLHTDSSAMPKTKAAWSSWNYRMEKIRGEMKTFTVYWMNSLQKVSNKKNYYVSINDPGTVDKKKIIQEIEYSHPLFSVESFKAQDKLFELNSQGNIFFCGSYFRNGFHEDGLWSAKLLSETLLNRRIWN